MDMLLIIAFACFTLLFAGWIVAPNSSATQPEIAAEPIGMMPDPATSPV